MKTRIFNLVILDESGSMGAIKTYAINSVNETLQTIRAAAHENEELEQKVLLVTFNTRAKTLCDCASADEATELTADTYLPNGCTALYDAMGMSLSHLRTQVAETDKVLVTIITDGMENASREYSGKAIKELVNELKSKGWVFAYIGANHDVEAAADNIGVTNRMKYHPDADGIAEMSEKLKRARKRFMLLHHPDRDWSKDVDADYDFFKED